MALVVTCIDPVVVEGDPASACPSADLVFKEEATFWDPSLSLTDVSDLLAAILFTFVLVWGFRSLYFFILNRR
jgi:flagellar biogenesis protein FliO